jgi:hypothetical protein
MINQNEALVVTSYNITGRGVIADIQHVRQGLPPGTELYSQESGKEWRVKNRLLFSHTDQEQQVFPNEEPAYAHFSFRSVEDAFNPKKAILDREAQQIYQYTLQPVGHADKPPEGEVLTIIIA